MFAGPNGSGKSTLIQEVRRSYNVGYFINADEIEFLLTKQKYLECSHFFPKAISQKDWDDFFNSKIKNDIRVNNHFPMVLISENLLVCKGEVNSYHASVIAEFFREKLLMEDFTFSFETVMSHPSKVQFLKDALKNGFTTYLYFICTQDPEINLQRILNRVEKGGHHVDAKKANDRYFRSLGFLYDAFMVADRAFVIDSSNRSRDVILEKKKNQIIIQKKGIPEWVGLYLLDKIE